MRQPARFCSPLVMPPVRLAAPTMAPRMTSPRRARTTATTIWISIIRLPVKPTRRELPA